MIGGGLFGLLDGLLLASIDGAARLHVDGKLVWEKAARSLRGGGWDRDRDGVPNRHDRRPGNPYRH